MLRTGECTFLWAPWGKVQLGAVHDTPTGRMMILRFFSKLVRHEKSGHTCKLGTRGGHCAGSEQVLMVIPSTSKDLARSYCTFNCTHTYFHASTLLFVFSSFVPCEVAFDGHPFVHSTQKYSRRPHCMSDVVLGTVGTVMKKKHMSPALTEFSV